MNKLDWTRLLGFNQVAGDREIIREANLTSKIGPKAGGKLGSKLGSKPGVKTSKF